MKNLDASRHLDAVVMAGGLYKWRPGKLINKNLLKLRGKPLFVRTMNALMQVDKFRRIYIVGPKADIEAELAKIRGTFKKEVVVLQEADSLVNNMLLAFDHSVGARVDDVSTRPDLAESQIFAVGGDCPLLLPEEVEQFLERCDMAKYDYCIGMTTDKVLDRFRTKKFKRGISLAYVHFSEGVLRVNNMHLVKPLKVINRRDLDEFYAIRHLKKLRNIFKLAYALYKRNMGFRDWVGLIKMYVAMWSGRAGMHRLADRLRKEITYSRVEEVVSGFLGAKVKMVITTYGGSALDVDKPSNIRVMTKRYDEWVALQKQIAAEMKKNEV